MFIEYALSLIHIKINLHLNSLRFVNFLEKLSLNAKNSLNQGLRRIALFPLGLEDSRNFSENDLQKVRQKIRGSNRYPKRNC